MNRKEEIQRYKELHHALDVLLAEYLMQNKNTFPSTTSVMDLLEWSCYRIESTEGK